MMMKKLALAGLIAAAPGFAMADGIAASLSASFGFTDGNGGVQFGEAPDFLGANAINPSSVSVSAAAGAYATASAVATPVSTGALSAGSDTPIIANVTNQTATEGDQGLAYESSVSFGLPVQEITDLVNDLVCGTGAFPVTGIVDVNDVDVPVEGELTCATVTP